MFVTWDPIYSPFSISPEPVTLMFTSLPLHLMDFAQDDHTRFVAAIDASTTVHLTGTVISTQKSALVSTTSIPPLHESLWHCCPGRYHQSGVRKLLNDGVVLGLKLDLSASANPICESYLSGKDRICKPCLILLHFYFSSQTASWPMAFIHSDIQSTLHECIHP